MFANRSLTLKVMSLTAAIAVGTGSVIAGPPKGGNGGGGISRSMGGASMARSMPSGGGNVFKQGGVGQVGNVGGIKVNPSPLNVGGGNNGGMKVNPNPIKLPNGNTGVAGGIKIDPGKGNGPINGGGIKIDPGKGNGPIMGQKGPGGMHQGQKYPNGVKPWMQKPTNGQHTIFCKTKCDPYYYQKCGIKASYGYCYKGFDHCHWYCQKWHPKHNCWFYFDQGCNNWYYWCEQDVCYYPCTYLPYKTYCTPVYETAVVPYSYQVPVVTTVPVTTYKQVVTYKTVTGYQTVPAHDGYQTPVGYPTNGGHATPVNYQAGPMGPQQGQPAPAGDPGQVQVPPLPGE